MSEHDDKVNTAVLREREKMRRLIAHDEEGNTITQAYANRLFAELKRLREDKARIATRLRCIAESTNSHSTTHTCFNDDCAICYPGDFYDEIIEWCDGTKGQGDA